MGWANNRAKYNLGEIKRVELRDVWGAGLDRLFPRRVDARRQKADGIMNPFCLYAEQRRDAIRLSVGKAQTRCAERVEQQVARAFETS